MSCSHFITAWGKVRFRNGCSYEWSTMFPGDDCCYLLTWFLLGEGTPKLNSSTLMMCYLLSSSCQRFFFCDFIFLIRSHFITVWETVWQISFDGMVDRLCYSWVLFVIFFMGMRPKFKNSNRIVLSSVIIILWTTVLLILYIHIYICTYKLLVLSVCWCPLVFVHFFGATCATGNLACCCSSPLAAFIFCKVQTRRCFQISHHADRSSYTVNAHMYVYIICSILNLFCWSVRVRMSSLFIPSHGTKSKKSWFCLESRSWTLLLNPPLHLS